MISEMAFMLALFRRLRENKLEGELTRYEAD